MKFIDPNYDPNKAENQEKMEKKKKKRIKSIRKKKLNKIKIKESNWNQAKKIKRKDFVKSLNLLSKLY